MGCILISGYKAHVKIQQQQQKRKIKLKPGDPCCGKVTDVLYPSSVVNPEKQQMYPSSM